MKSYEFKGSFYERVAKARALNSMTQSELAKLVGISQRQIAAYESANSYPRQGVLHKLADALGTTVEWLATGEGDGKIKSRVSPASVTTKVPLLEIDKVLAFLSHEYRAEGLTTKFHPTSYPVSKMAFAVINSDEAMAYSDPDGYGFPVGSIIVFDPMIEAEHLDFVCALKSDFILFRQIFISYDQSVLNPLDNRYPQKTIKNEERESMFLIPAISVETQLPAATRLDE
ncbi:helix-turn-helix domain-containing protein [Yersinia enterocolitica]|uniref:helix-turn-helix domain-containing protein n=1 Tax=Yersinia TaxID=629 RepID=UPI00119F528D|nr:helix-turn-helix transcriptional regulator [Yersinia rochesterensis]EKN3342535.1 helix-turn-helix transcriptional regulator [Yersinia enterocolitica]EKN3571937.1 helix-turn-helix transcriptional regulator [Yersinia enterocolitica]EKN4745077.1 helix-turn-helix transcriptional regulator [Yersinia enterocolitica]EKN6013616.1 XRE family transcriptional regulator [Yersinia enterocolitica]EKN6209344.1 XRE family transcriptional regulator [Yersinia enterocolitica]